MVERSVMITNKLGMHLRAAHELVQTASRFQSEIRLSREDIEVDAKSIMALLGLEGAQGVEVTVSAEGPDEEDALRAVVGLIEAKFNEDE